GFSVQVGDPIDSDIGAGLVAEQTPGAGRVASGTTVTLRPSTGNKPAAPATVPNVTGAKFNQAKPALEGAGFGVTAEGCKNGSTVNGQNPPAGTAAPAGTVVTLTCAGDG